MSATQAMVELITRGADLEEKRIIIDRRPITTNSISNPSFDPATVQQDSEATRIVVHERFPQLVVDFLNHKRQYGSQVERALYNDPGWNWQLQVARLSMYIHPNLAVYDILFASFHISDFMTTKHTRFPVWIFEQTTVSSLADTML